MVVYVQPGHAASCHFQHRVCGLLQSSGSPGADILLFRKLSQELARDGLLSFFPDSRKKSLGHPAPVLCGPRHPCAPRSHILSSFFLKKKDRCWLLINPVNLAAVNSLALVESRVKVNDLPSISSMFFQKELDKEVRMGKRHHTRRDRTGTLRSNFY